ncbi:hypothetical protein ASE95_16170 [Sphingomonas sp. Leaf231]|uniref:hypothetical protein n=1 Tax=Sphingomonas sp. Leaf231 TaxID=1736301 RepID=UPI0006F3CB52|nr:hypothetical protein [Sphingomonas sp. Leaf231]KQN90214.1 hypothetical protein ASE95_16170 [Sphingomonas sp. Leaf231]
MGQQDGRDHYDELRVVLMASLIAAFASPPSTVVKPTIVQCAKPQQGLCKPLAGAFERIGRTVEVTPPTALHGSDGYADARVQKGALPD